MSLDIEQLLKQVTIDDNGCWILESYPNRPPNAYYNGKLMSSAKASFSFYTGYEWKKGDWCCHKCGDQFENGYCLNPKHIYVGTAKSNAIDRVQNGTHFPTGLLETHPQAKLSNDLVQQIRIRLKEDKILLGRRRGYGSGDKRTADRGLKATKREFQKLYPFITDGDINNLYYKGAWKKLPEINDFTTVWLEKLSEIFHNGHIISPRGNRTKELLNSIISFDMNYPILQVPTRKLGTALLCYEPYWYLSGSNLLSDIEPYCPRMKQYSDNGMTLSGAYGPRIVSQLDYVVDCLINDSVSRQAIINIWRDSPETSKDIACTLNYQFFIRQNKLQMIVNMRSSDIYTGVPYDCFSQTMIALNVCLRLRNAYPYLELGNLTLRAGSQHYYESDLLNINEILLTGSDIVDNPRMKLNYNYDMTPDDLKAYLKNCAKLLKSGKEIEDGFLKGLKPKNG